jgi:hypothetical protein
MTDLEVRRWRCGTSVSQRDREQFHTSENLACAVRVETSVGRHRLTRRGQFAGAKRSFGHPSENDTTTSVSSAIPRSRRYWRLHTSSKWENSEGERGIPQTDCSSAGTTTRPSSGTCSRSPMSTIVPHPDLSFESQWLQRTITDRAGEAVAFPNDPPSSEYLGQYNERFS